MTRRMRSAGKSRSCMTDRRSRVSSHFERRTRPCDPRSEWARERSCTPPRRAGGRVQRCLSVLPGRLVRPFDQTEFGGTNLDCKMSGRVIAVCHRTYLVSLHHPSMDPSQLGSSASPPHPRLPSTEHALPSHASSHQIVCAGSKELPDQKKPCMVEA